jgi:hypothetical protein
LDLERAKEEIGTLRGLRGELMEVRAQLDEKKWGIREREERYEADRVALEEEINHWKSVASDRAALRDEVEVPAPNTALLLFCLESILSPSVFSQVNEVSRYVRGSQNLSGVLHAVFFICNTCAGITCLSACNPETIWKGIGTVRLIFGLCSTGALQQQRFLY